MITHRDEAHLHQYQLFVYDRLARRAVYGSFAMAGARPAAPIAAAWAIMNFLGRGRATCELAREVLETPRKLRDGIDSDPRAARVGRPGDERDVASAPRTMLDIFAVGDVMDDRGWHLDRQNGPGRAPHDGVPEHAEVADAFLADLRDAVAHHGSSRGKEARYS